MKVNVYGKLIDLKIDYRFNKADVDSIKSAIENNGVIRHITRIKIYHHCIKKLKSSDKNKPFMCTIIGNIIIKSNKLHIIPSISLEKILPEFNKKNYRKIINTDYPKGGNAWDWQDNIDNRIKFLEAIKRQCAVEYLSLRKY